MRSKDLTEDYIFNNYLIGKDQLSLLEVVDIFEDIYCKVGSSYNGYVKYLYYWKHEDFDFEKLYYSIRKKLLSALDLHCIKYDVDAVKRTLRY